MSLEACLESSLAGLELGEGRRGEARRAPQVLLVMLLMVMVMVMVMVAVVGLLVVMNH